MRNSEPLTAPLIVIALISIILLLYVIYTDEDIQKKTIEPVKPVDSMIVFSVKPSDKLLVAVWDSELDCYKSFTASADSIANGVGTTLIHRDDR